MEVSNWSCRTRRRHKHWSHERSERRDRGLIQNLLKCLHSGKATKYFLVNQTFFFVCMLRPISSGITTQELEIEAAQWMPIEEFAAQPFVKKHELVKYIVDVGLAKVDKGYDGLRGS